MKKSYRKKKLESKDLKVVFTVGSNRLEVYTRKGHHLVDAANLQYDPCELSPEAQQRLANELVAHVVLKSLPQLSQAAIPQYTRASVEKIRESISRLIKLGPFSPGPSALTLSASLMELVSKYAGEVADISAKGSLSDISWPCRNIYECYLWLAYLHSNSEEQFRKFIGYTVFDYCQVMDGFKSVRDRLDTHYKMSKDLSELQIEGHKMRIRTQGDALNAVEAGRVMKTSDLASFVDWIALRKAKQKVAGLKISAIDDYVLRDAIIAEQDYKLNRHKYPNPQDFWKTQDFHILRDYKAFWKIASKMVHPSSFSVGANLSNDNSTVIAMRSVLVSKALQYAEMARDVFREMVWRKQAELPPIDTDLPAFKYRDL